MQDLNQLIQPITNQIVDKTRRRLVAEATRRSSDLILKESFLSQLLFPTMHEIVDDGHDVLCFCRYPGNLIISIFFIPSLFFREDAEGLSREFVLHIPSVS